MTAADRGGDLGKAAPEVAPVEQDLPNVELTGSILFRLLSADMAAQEQQYSWAADLYLLVAQESRDPRIAENATRMALFSRNDTAALAAGRLWVTLRPDDRTAREAAIAALIRNGDDQGVQEHLDYMLGHGAESSELLYQLVVSLVQHNQIQDIRTGYRAMVSLAKRHPNNPDALFALGYIAIHNNELAAARTALEAVLKQRPQQLEAMNLYARVLRMQDHPYEAAIYLAGVLKKFPDSVAVRLNYARLLVETRQLDDALEQYLWVVENQPRNEDAIFVAALLSMQLNALDQSQDLLHRLVDMGRRLDAANFYLGQLAEMLDQSDSAIDYYAAVESGEHFTDAQLSLAGLLARHGDVLLARANLDKLRLSNPADLNRIDALDGRILESDGQLDQALAVYESALVRAPQDRQLLISQAILADKLGQFEVVERNLVRVLGQRPDDVAALNSLGFSMSNHTTRYQEAYGYLERAVQLRPNSGAILDSMGWVLYKLGRLDESVDYLRRSLALFDDEEVSAHLGEVLWMRGEHEEARDVWKQALEKSPDGELVRDVMKRFGQ